MQLTTITASLAVAAIVAAFAHAAPCDFAAIEASLYSNATEGLQRCAEATGFNIFSFGELPTQEQANAISENTDCANFYNQITTVANNATQCDVVINGTTYELQGLIADFLSGKTGEDGQNASGSSSEDIEFPSDSGSESVSASGSESSSASGSSSEGSVSGSGSSGAGAASLSAAIAAAAVVAAFAA